MYSSFTVTATATTTTDVDNTENNKVGYKSPLMNNDYLFRLYGAIEYEVYKLNFLKDTNSQIPLIHHKREYYLCSDIEYPAPLHDPRASQFTLETQTPPQPQFQAPTLPNYTSWLNREARAQRAPDRITPDLSGVTGRWV